MYFSQFPIFFFSIIFLFSGGIIFSQTGPAGVGNSATNELWLIAEGNVFTDAGVTVGANGSSIEQWSDISGNNNHASQTNATFKPILSTNKANGHSSLVFDGSNSRILASGLTTNNQVTVFAVVMFNNLTNNNDGIIQAGPSGTAFSATTTNKSIGMWINTGTGRIWGRGVQSNNTMRSLPQNSILTTGQFYVLALDFDGTDITQYVDGTAVGSISYDGTIKSWTDFGIGRQSGESLDGEITEVIAHKVSLNNVERILTENYLAASYGITLSANDIYLQDDVANGNYDYNVVGIGRIDASNLNNDAQSNNLLRISNATDLNDDEFLIFGHNNAVLGTFGNADVPATMEGRWHREWRVSEVDITGSSVDVGSIDLDFNLTGLTYANVNDIGLLVDTDNDGVFADETPIVGAVDLGGNVVRFSGVSAIADNLRFTLGTFDIDNSPLPVELISFEAIARDDQVNLYWSTASEINSSHFAIERSQNGYDWEEIITTHSAGNSTTQIDYFSIDYTPLSGKSFYRLVQYDNDGQNKTYNVVPVVISANNS